MIDAHATFTELRALLARLPGISVESTDISPNVLSMTLCAARSDSIGPVVYSAGGANIPVEVWSVAPQGQVAERTNPMCLRYCLRSLVRHGGAEQALDRFAMFGNFVVWHLHAIGSIPTDEANRLLTLWDGTHVGA